MAEKDVEQQTEKQEKPKKEKKLTHKEHIEKLEAEIQELTNKYLRNAAELENFKKRMQQERILDRKYAASNFLGDFLNPYEQFSKILEFPTDNDVLKNYLVGFKMIKDQFEQVLASEGVREIKALNENFDPKLHHAVDKVEDKDKAQGLIVEVLQKGYTYKDRILRPAMVKVNEWSDEENGENK